MNSVSSGATIGVSIFLLRYFFLLLLDQVIEISLVSIFREPGFASNSFSEICLDISSFLIVLSFISIDIGPLPVTSGLVLTFGSSRNEIVHDILKLNIR